MCHLEHALPGLGAEHCAWSTAVSERLGFIMNKAPLHVDAGAGYPPYVLLCTHSTCCTGLDAHMFQLPSPYSQTPDVTLVFNHD